MTVSDVTVEVGARLVMWRRAPMYVAATLAAVAGKLRGRRVAVALLRCVPVQRTKVYVDGRHVRTLHHRIEVERIEDGIQVTVAEVDR